MAAQSEIAGDEEQDVFVTESDYEEAFDTEKVNEERLLTQGAVYYFRVNCKTLPDALLPTSTALGPPPHYGTNTIKTAHYTWWNFVPLNLALQFRHYYNIYFLIAAILSLIPSISPINPLATVLPLLIVVGLTFIKDGYADTKRHHVDRTVNDKMFLVCHRGHWSSVKSSRIQVGDLVFVTRNEKFPADCILARVDREDDIKNEGGCFVETSDLDGESNMKRKEIPPLLRDLLYRKRKLMLAGYSGTSEDERRLMSDFQAFVECEAPNNSIHSFVGLLKVANVRGLVQRSPPSSPQLEDLDEYTLQKAHFDQKRGALSPSTLHESVFREILTIPLDYQHFIPRGASLKSTTFAIGAVVYVGKNTKVFKNVKKRRRGKESTLTTALNRLMLLVFAINFFVLALATLFGGLYLKRFGQFSEYVLPTVGDSIQTVALQQLAAYYILFQYFVPLSLFISIEVARLFLALFIQADDYLAPEAHRGADNARPSSIRRRFSRKQLFLQADGHCQVRNFNVHEDLAKVSYIFSDKTGTLTLNMMRLSHWGIWHNNKVNLMDEQADPGCLGRVISHSSPFHDGFSHYETFRSQLQGELHRSDRELNPQSDVTALTAQRGQSYDLPLSSTKPVSSNTLSNNADESDFGAAAGLYGRLVALCHGVLPSASDSDDQAWEGQSPDEVALVEAAAATGIRLVKRTKRKMTLEVNGHLEEYTLLHTLDFSSERKRMSVVIRVRHTSGHGYFVLSKGADSVMLPLLDNRCGPILQASVDELARRGLRVLVLAAREISIETYEAFREALEAAEGDIHRRAVRYADAYSLLEAKFLPVGVVAIEDKLQPHVPTTLAFLLAAGIRIWLLTGDKRETAINIGMSSQLIRSDMIICTLDAAETLLSYYNALYKLVKVLYGNCPSIQSTDITSSEDLDLAIINLTQFILAAGQPACVALILDGQLIDASVQRNCPLFIQLARTCASVIVCRASPLQKARVVTLVRSQTSAVTLAIGDGANDVAMIEAAHIGVGIAGREGGQASRAADYALAEFRFLKRLLVIHGRYAYLRLSKLILVSIYKNAMLALTIFWFGIASAWSAQTLYSALFLFLYNIIFTSLAPMVIALFEKDVSEKQLLKYPQLYTPLAAGAFFGPRQVAKTFFWSLIHSIIIFFIVYGIFNETDCSNSNGKVGGLALLQTFVSTMVFLTVNIRILLIHRHRNIFTLLVFSISIVLFIGNLFLFNLGSFLGKDAGLIAMQLPSFFLANILVVLACIFPEYAIKYFRKQYYPSDADILHEWDILHAGKMVAPL